MIDLTGKFRGWGGVRSGSNICVLT